MQQTVRDKTGRDIVRGDIVKVYHFTGARRKRYYMYKQALGITRYLPSGVAVMKFSHLSFDDSFNGSYEAYGPVLSDYEIVQSIKCDHEDRPRQC